MVIRTPFAAGLCLAAGLAAFGTGSVASAATPSPVCDAYSGTCTTPPVTQPPGGGGGGEESTGSGSTGGGETGVDGGGGGGGDLPFTGGEAVLITVLGAGALAGGTALVLAGRRRHSAGPA